MAPQVRNCLTHLTWRYVALTCFLGSLIAAPIPIGFGSVFVQSEAQWLCAIVSGWWFLGFFWNLFFIIWESVRKEAIHPGAVVGLDLAITLYGLGGAITWGIWSIVDVNFQYRWQFEWDGIAPVTLADRDQSISCFIAFVVFASISTSIHFTLFIIGCINEDRRRKAITAQLKSAKAAVAAKLDNGEDAAQYGHGYYDPASAAARQSGPPGYLASVNSAAAAKQAEIERMERESGSGEADVGASPQYEQADVKASHQYE